MEMKLEEAQICRLCGECESIYIDVFGEEGTKRFLGVKIHTKINILISEADGLPHNVCIRCLGALEFLCDFHEQCHKTQEKLTAAQKCQEAQKRQETVPKPLDPELDEDFDKENTAPTPKSGIKRKKSIYPEEQKNGQVAHVAVDKRHKTAAEESEKSRPEIKRNEKEKEKENEINEMKIDENGATQKAKNQENKENGQDDVAKNKIDKDKTNKNKETTPNENVGKTKKGKVEEKNLNIEAPKKSNNSNKTSSPFKKINASKTSIKTESALKISPREEKKITDWLKKVPQSEVPNFTVEKCDKSVEKTSVTGTKTMLQSSEPSDITVKVENDENLVEAAISKGKILTKNKIVWIPNMIQLPEGLSLKSTRLGKLHGNSPPRGDEAEKQSVSTPSCSSDKKFENKKERASMELARESMMMEKPDTKIDDGSSKRREPRSVAKKLSIIESRDEEESADETDDDGNTKSKKFSKITDLITDEQKEAIEKYYNCNMSVVDERRVMDHVVYLGRKKFTCKLCDACYTRQDKCQVHIWGHLDMKPYRCNACDFSTVTVSNIRCHVRKSHLKIKPFACEICEKRYVTSFLLEEHLNTHTGLRPYACDVCEFTSASRQVLSYHKTTHKPVKDVTCNVCGKEFFSKNRLRAHLIIHNKDKAANMCKFCSIYLCNNEALQKHYANVHNRDYECDVCGKRCKSKKALNNHQNVHSAAKYKCTLCSNVYKSSHILKEHLLKHEGIRKYKCNVCQKDFAQQSHLAAHMAVHSDKRFLCPGCKRPFNRHDNMKMHTKRCEAFLANPGLATLLTIRRSQSKNLTKDTDKEGGVEKTVLSTVPTNTKTDVQINEERAIMNVPKTKDEYRESFTTVVVENTIPCT
ncbi:zinc finger protein 39-like isoform X1 [Venturia canescens]|uniref:zinc finger protein 39-like isoform X1 n=1 Tax=Venturia canescens TaxID=32260 RepID=UPI001C9BBFD4|nr:zinc finger protein 39-like isoform X1 [Venturia canescens]